MSVIQRKDLITDEAVNWPDEYKKDLDKIIATSKQLGQGTAKKNVTELSKVQKQLSIATERSTKEFIDQKAALNTLNTQTRNAVKDVQNLDNAYDKLSKELNDTRKSYKNLSAAGKANTDTAKAQLAQIKKLDGQLKKIDSSVGQNQRSVGKYSDALKGMGTQLLGVVGGITAFVAILKSGLQIIRNYTKANSTLNAVLGLTSKGTKALRIQQKALGETTAFSASEVAKAQTELARLGKTQREIIDLTPSILNAAIAMGVDLAQAAELVAGQLNAFNLAADQGGRVSDVLVKATQISAFNFDRLKTALATVSPAANAVNATIEDTVAVLSSAVDANIDASTAATGLRNIYIDLADKGITWDEAMATINNSTNKLSTANELFGKRGAIVATVIADNTEKINANKIALQGANGAAKEFAEETLKNLDGALTLANSAWEGFILSLDDGEGVITRVATSLVDLGTSILGVFTQMNKFTASDTLSFWDKFKTLLGVASGNVATVAESMAIIATTNASDQVQEMADALGDVAASGASKELDGIVAAAKELKAELQDLPALYKEDESKFLQSVKAKQRSIDALKQHQQDLADATKQRIKDELEAEKEAAEIKQEIIESSLELSSELFGGFADLRIQQIAQELDANEFARNRELEAAEDNERLKFEINKKFDAEKKQLLQKQANTEKANALFQIALNTAVAITRISAEAALAAPFLIPGIIAMGVIQAAAVIAAPVPQFDTGIESTPKDYIAGEKRPELRKSKGKWSLVNKPTLFKDSKGDKIISGKETDSILGGMADLTGNNILSDPSLLTGLLNNDFEKKKDSADLAYIIRKGNEDVVRAITRKPTLNISVSNSRTDVVERIGNKRVKRVDAVYRGKI